MSYHDSLIDDIHNTILDILTREDESALLMLACTCWTERRRYRDMSHYSTKKKKLVWQRDGCRTAMLAGHLELTRALLVECDPNERRLAFFTYALASPNPDILPLVIGSYPLHLSLFFSNYDISWPIFERFFMHQIGLHQMSNVIKKARSKEWLSSFIVSYYEQDYRRRTNGNILNDLGVVVKYGRLQDVQVTVSYLQSVVDWPLPRLIVCALHGAKLETLQWILATFPNATLHFPEDPIKAVLTLYDRLSKTRDDIFPMLHFLISRGFRASTGWAGSIIHRMQFLGESDTAMRTMISQLLELGFPNDVCDMGHLHSYPEVPGLVDWLKTRFRSVKL
jgi:hypothetical protein